MQYVRRIEPDRSGLVGFGVRTLVVSASDRCHDLVARISGLGTAVDIETDIYRAIERVTDDLGAFNICMVDCDSFGGLEVGRRFVHFLGEAISYLPIILLSRDVPTQYFSEHHTEPSVLRLPLSPVSARVGFEHSLRERFVLKAS